MKADQLRNPEYADIPQSMELRYKELIHELHTMTRWLNSTIAFNKVCLDSDDEDCFRNPFQNCNRAPDSVSHSGSGDGSGSGMDPDSETTTTVYNREDVTTTARPARPAPVSTESTALDTISDNSLGEEIRPAARPTTPTPVPTTPTTPTSQNPVTQIGGLDNNVPVGGIKDRVTIPYRNLKPNTVAKTTVTTVTTATTETTEGISTKGMTTISTTTVGMTTESTVTARVESDIDQEKGELVGEEHTTTIEDPEEISSSASPHQPWILTAVLVTTTLLGILH
jgi:hypothetical protein